jgi:hypothetical protein
MIDRVNRLGNVKQKRLKRMIGHDLDRIVSHAAMRRIATLMDDMMAIKCRCLAVPVVVKSTVLLRTYPLNST